MKQPLEITFENGKYEEIIRLNDIGQLKSKIKSMTLEEELEKKLMDDDFISDSHTNFRYNLKKLINSCDTNFRSMIIQNDKNKNKNKNINSRTQKQKKIFNSYTTFYKPRYKYKKGNCHIHHGLNDASKERDSIFENSNKNKNSINSINFKNSLNFKNSINSKKFKNNQAENLISKENPNKSTELYFFNENENENTKNEMTSRLRLQTAQIERIPGNNDIKENNYSRTSYRNENNRKFSFINFMKSQNNPSIPKSQFKHKFNLTLTSKHFSYKHSNNFEHALSNDQDNTSHYNYCNNKIYKNNKNNKIDRTARNRVIHHFIGGNGFSTNKGPSIDEKYIRRFNLRKESIKNFIKTITDLQKSERKMENEINRKHKELIQKRISVVDYLIKNSSNYYSPFLFESNQILKDKGRSVGKSQKKVDQLMLYAQIH